MLEDVKPCPVSTTTSSMSVIQPLLGFLVPTWHTYILHRAGILFIAYTALPKTVLKTVLGMEEAWDDI